MSSTPKPLLNPAPEANEATRLRREIAGLERELADAKEEAQTAKQASSDAVHAIRTLRKQLEPLYTSLKMIFGEISRVDAAKMADAESAPDAVTTANGKWEMIRERLGGRQAEFIELLQHGRMTAPQLAAAAHCRIRTAQNIVSSLKSAGFVKTNGGVHSLRE